MCEEAQRGDHGLVDLKDFSVARVTGAPARLNRRNSYGNLVPILSPALPLPPVRLAASMSASAERQDVVKRDSFLEVEESTATPESEVGSGIRIGLIDDEQDEEKFFSLYRSYDFPEEVYADKFRGKAHNGFSGRPSPAELLGLRPRHAAFKHPDRKFSFDFRRPLDGISVDVSEDEPHEKADVAADHEAQEKVHHWEGGRRTLNMWDGVVSWNILRTFGGVFFLRIGFIFGNAGLGLGIAVLLCCGAIALVTVTSLGAITSNGDQPYGGIYFGLSRSLGPKIGGAVGILLVLSLSVSAGLFAKTIGILVIREFGMIWNGSFWANTVAVSVPILILCLFIGVLGFKWITRFNLLLLSCLLISLIAIVIGASMKSYSSAWKSNVSSVLNPNYSFSELIGIFFPAFTGFTASAVLLGILKNPTVTFPRGMVVSSVSSTFVYILIGILLSGALSRSEMTQTSFILKEVSIFPAFAYLGFFVATISSALTSIITAPWIMYAVAEDGLFPFSRYLDKKLFSLNIPVLCFALSFVLALIIALIGTLNESSIYVTIVFLLACTVCHLISLSQSLGYQFFLLSRVFSQVTELASPVLILQSMALSDCCSGLYRLDDAHKCHLCFNCWSDLRSRLLGILVFL
jgi:amino acid transporter